MSLRTLWIPYCGAAPTPAEWLGRWNLDPWLLIAAGGLAWAFHARLVRGELGRPGAFGAALTLLAILFVSPFCALSSALFSARVAHHVLLAAAVAPLLVAACRPGAPLWPGSLGAWTALQAFVFWGWHAPPLYAAALSNDAVYWLMQASLLGVAFGFWGAVRRASAPAAAGGLLGTTIQMGLLGALLTFSGRPLYAPHLASTVPWGFAPLEDQQLAGLIMWAPGAGFYLAAAMIIFARWFGREARADASVLARPAL